MTAVTGLRFTAAFILLALFGCDDPEAERELLNEAAGTAEIFEDELFVHVFGGAVVAHDILESGIQRVRIRAQSLDLRVEVRDLGCRPQVVRIEVSHLPTGFTSTYRTLLDAESTVAEDATFEGDPHDPTRTPLEAERAFETTLTSDGVHAWTVRSARSRRVAIVLGAGSDDVEIVEGSGACASLDTDASGELGQAALIVRHRLRATPSLPYDFAVWGNNAGHIGARAALVESVRAQAEGLAFALVTGDLTEQGTTAQLEVAAQMYDGTDATPGLGFPWYATVGDRDIAGDAARGFADVLGRSTFAFDAGPLRLIMLDSADFTLAPGAISKLTDWLPVDAALWWSGDPAPAYRMVFTHVPPFEPFGGRGAGFKHRREAARIMAALRRNDVRGLFASHLSLFEEKDVAGVPVVYSGGAGADVETTEGTSRHWVRVTVHGPGADPPISWERVSF